MRSWVAGLGVRWGCGWKRGAGDGMSDCIEADCAHQGILALLIPLPGPEHSALSSSLLQNWEVDGHKCVRRNIWSTAKFMSKSVEYYYYLIVTLLFTH